MSHGSIGEEHQQTTMCLLYDCIYLYIYVCIYTPVYKILISSYVGKDSSMDFVLCFWPAFRAGDAVVVADGDDDGGGWI